MPLEQIPFDCAEPLRTWRVDPDKTTTDNLLYLVEIYSQAYRRMVSEIRRLEAANSVSPTRQQPEDSEYSEIQELIDASIDYLDLDRE